MAYVLGQFLKTSFDRHIINLGSVPSDPTKQGIFHLGVYPQTFTFRPTGAVISGPNLYQDKWSRLYTTGNWQMVVKVQIGVNLEAWNIPTQYQDTSTYKILTQPRLTSPVTPTALSWYFSMGSNARTYIEEAFYNADWNSSGIYAYASCKPGGHNMGFAPFAPISTAEVYDGLLPFEYPAFQTVSQSHLITGVRGGLYQGILYFAPTTASSSDLVAINVNDTTNASILSSQAPWMIPPLRTPFDVLWQPTASGQATFYIRYFVDVEPIP